MEPCLLGEASGRPGLFLLLHFCSMFTLHINIASTLGSGNSVIFGDRQTSAPWCWVAFHFQGIGSLLFHVGGDGEGLLGKSPSFYCSKSSVKHLNLHLSKSLLVWGLPPLQLLRIAERKYHLSQWDFNGGFPVWTPTLNSLETEVLGIVFFINLAQTFTGSHFSENLFEKDSCLIFFRPTCIKLGKNRANWFHVLMYERNLQVCIWKTFNT